MAASRIVVLSQTIANQTALIEDFCKRAKISSPSFDIDAPATVKIPPSEPAVVEARDSVIAAARELKLLMQGPAETVADLGFVDAFVWQTISRYRIAEHVPVGKEIPYEDVAQACGLRVDTLRRILRFAMTNGYFTESRPDHVAHTSASRLIAEDELLRLAVAFFSDENIPATHKGCDALQLYPESDEPTLSGWGLANNAQAPFFQELQERHPDRYRTVTSAMHAWNSWIPASPLNTNYPWSTVKKMVDIGGGHGLVSLSIARHDPTPYFIVQDQPGVIADGPASIPAEFSNRIEFMAHDMFEEQPVKDADVYFFRSVFHDWPDSSCVRILKALTPALKPGARIVINDACMPPMGTLPPHANRMKRVWDLHMMLLSNGRDRGNGDWENLFKTADPRFKFLGSRLPTVGVEGIPPAGLLSIIEAVWEP